MKTSIKIKKKTIHSKLTRPFLWLRLNETLQWKKFLYFKHCYTSERMILFTQLKNDHTVKNSVLASDTWFLLKCRKAAASSPVLWNTCFFSISTSNYVTMLLSSYSLFVMSFNWIRSLFSLEFEIPLSGLELQCHALALTIKYTSFK